MDIKYKLALFCLAALCPFAGKAESFTLSECERLGIENNRKIKSGKLEIEMASQTRKEAFTKYFPTVSGVGSYYNANHGLAKTEIGIPGLLPAPIPISMLKNGLLGGVTATQPVFVGGRIVNSNKLAKIGENVAELQLQLTEDEVVLKTRSYFWEIVNLNEKLNTISIVEKMLQNLLTDVQTAVKAGVVNRNDQLRVELQIQEVASDRLKVENGLKVYKMLLAQFVGEDIDTFDIQYADVSNSRLEPGDYYRNPNDAVYDRIESRLLDQNTDAAKLNTRLSRGSHLPSVAVGGGYLYNDLMDNSNNAGVIYATVSVPISDWWGGSHATKKNKIKEIQVENDRQDAIELMIVEINQTWNDLVEAHEQILLAQKSIESSTENLKINNDFYKAGMIPLTELLDAQVLFQQSRNQYNDAYSNYQVKLTRYLQISRAQGMREMPE